MKKNLRLVVVMVTIAALVLCMTGCKGSQTDTSAEAEAEAAAEEAVLELYIAENIEPYVVAAEAAASLEEAELPEVLATADYAEAEYYADANGNKDFAVFRLNNSEGLALEDELNSAGKKFNGCVGLKSWTDGTTCGAMSFFDDYTLLKDDGTADPCIVTSLLFEDTANNQFVWVSVWYHTDEEPIGVSGYGFWMPGDYVSEELTEDDLAMSYVGRYTTENIYLPGIETEEFVPENDCTLEELVELYHAEADSTVVEEFIKNINGVDMHMCDCRSTVDGAEQTEVRITFKNGEEFVRMSLKAPTENWMEIGEAFAYSIHELAM